MRSEVTFKLKLKEYFVGIAQISSKTNKIKTQVLINRSKFISVMYLALKIVIYNEGKLHGFIKRINNLHCMFDTNS